MKGHGVASHSSRSSFARSRIARGEVPKEPEIERQTREQ